MSVAIEDPRRDGPRCRSRARRPPGSNAGRRLNRSTPSSPRTPPAATPTPSAPRMRLAGTPRRSATDTRCPCTPPGPLPWGRESTPAPRDLPGDRIVAQGLGDRSLRDGAGAYHDRLAVREIDDGRGRADERFRCAEVHLDVAAERRLDLVARRGRGRAAAVRARHRERPRAREHREGERVVRHPDADRRRVAAEVPRPSDLGARQHDRERAGPEAERERLGAFVEARDPPGGLLRGHEDRELELARASLGLEQPGGRRGIVGPRPDAVDRVRRQHDERSLERRARGGLDRVERGRHGALARTTRSRPARSRSTLTSANRSESTRTTSSPILASISTARTPPSRSQRAACAPSRS